MNRVADARMMNSKGFNKLDASSPYAVESEYDAPSVGCKFCGLIEPLCRCGDMISYNSTKLQAVAIGQSLCSCGCSVATCQLCSCNSQCV